jgi:hypothetical protein
MTIELPVTPTTFEKLKSFSANTGKSVAEIILEAVEEKLADEAAAESILANGEWIDQLRAWSNSHPVRTTIVDDSRDSIYEGRGS